MSRVKYCAAGMSFHHVLVKVSAAGLVLHTCGSGAETVSVTLTFFVSVAPALTVILNVIVAVYVPASRPLLSTIIKTSLLSPACKDPLADLTVSQFAPSSVTIGAGTDQEPASPQLVIPSV